jgi:hypothetical protein
MMTSAIVLLLIAALASGNAGVLVEGLARDGAASVRDGGRVAVQAVDDLARLAAGAVVDRFLRDLPFELKDAARRAARALRLLVQLRSWLRVRSGWCREPGILQSEPVQ